MCSTKNYLKFHFLKLGYHSVYRPKSEMKEQGTYKRKNDTSSEMLSLVPCGKILTSLDI